MSRPPQAFRPFMALVPIGALYLASLVRLIMLQGHLDPTDAMGQVRRSTPLPAARGSILDRNGHVLAEDVHSWNLVVAYPPKHRSLVQAVEDGSLTPFEVEERVRILAEGVGVPFPRLWSALLVDPNAAHVLRRGISPTQRESILRTMQVKSLRYTGLSLEQKFQRVYPNGPVLGHLVGLPPSGEEQGTPGSGLERGLDELLAGQDGERRAIGVSGRHGVDPALDMEEPLPGRSVRTTLDLELATYARGQLVELLQQHEAERCFAIAVDVKNGQVLAMLGLPDYDPNDPLGSMQERVDSDTGKTVWDGWVYPGIWHVEPGSAFKPLVAAYALDRGAIGEDQWFENFGGTYLPPRRSSADPISNSRGVPDDPMRAFEAIVHSSNVVFAQIARAIGREGMADLLDHYGFHPRIHYLPGLALDLQPRVVPDRATFLLERSPDGMAYNIPTMGYGQGFDVPPLDLAMALASIANGGLLLAPTLDPRASKEPLRRVLSASSTAYVREAMHGMVMLEQRKWLPHRKEFDYCGKSGTAMIRYGPFKDRYTSLFTAFGPLEDPQVLVLVVAFGTHFSGPGGPHHFGSKVCGPAAANILHHALETRGVVATNPAESLEWRASAATLQRD